MDEEKIICFRFVGESLTLTRFHFTVAGCHFGGICTDGLVWYGTLDSADAEPTILVHSITLLVFSWGTSLVARAVGQSTVILYCRGERKSTATRL